MVKDDSIVAGQNFLLSEGTPTNPLDGPGVYYCMVTYAGQPNAVRSNDLFLTNFLSYAPYSYFFTASFSGLSMYHVDTVSTCSGTGAIILQYNLSNKMIAYRYPPSINLWTYQWKKNGVNIPAFFDHSTEAPYFLHVPFDSNANGSYTLTISNYLCSFTSYPIVINITIPSTIINSSGPLTFCQGDSVTLTAPSGVGYTYSWYKNGSFTGTGQTCVAKLSGNYTVVITSGSCNASSGGVTVVVNANLNPVAISPSGNVNLCPGHFIQLNVYDYTATSFSWVRNGVGVGVGNYYYATLPGSYYVVAHNACGSVASSLLNLISDTSTVIASISNSTPSGCTDSIQLSTPASPFFYYQWKYAGSNISGATSSNYFAKNSGNYSVVVTNACRSSSASVNLSIGNIANAIVNPSGQVNICSGQTVLLTCSNEINTTYQWKINNINIQGATLNTYSASLTGSYTCVMTNMCGNSTSNAATIQNTPIPSTPGTITGIAKPCPGDTGVAYSVANNANALTYNWTMPIGASISSGAGTRSIKINFASTFVSGTISVTASNACGTSGVRNKTVSRNIPGTPSAIAGQVLGVCGTTSGYSINSTATATTYLWSVPLGVIINNGQGTTSINVTFPSNITTGIISVKAGNNCGYGTQRNLTVKGMPATAVAITGPITACANQAGVTYSTASIPNATSYTWGVPSGATITSGQGTTAIVMKFKTAGGNVRVRGVNACGVGSYKNLAVTINCRESLSAVENAFDVSIYPNPTNNYFSINIISPDQSNYQLVLRDLLGRKIKSFDNLKSGEVFDFGFELINGIYFVEILQGDNRKVMRLVKSE